MSSITLQNYEAFLLDFHEGNLSAAQQLLLADFLDEHPELKESVEEMEWPILEKEGVIFDEKELLKHSKSAPNITKENHAYYFIAELEADLLLNEQQQLDQYVELHPAAKKERLTYQRLRLQPDLSTQFPAKSRLRQQKRIAAYWYPISAIAASLLLYFGLTTFQRTTLQDMVVQHKTDVEKDSKMATTFNYNITGSRQHPRGMKLTTVADKSTSLLPKTDFASRQLPQLERKKNLTEQLASKTSIEQGMEKEERLKVVTSPQVMEKEEIQLAVVEEEITENNYVNTKQPKEEYLSIRKYLQRKLEDVLGGPSEDELTNPELVVERIGKGISKTVGGKLSVEKNKQGTLTAFALKIGKFELSRKKSVTNP
jgi:hypothetical protein